MRRPEESTVSPGVDLLHIVEEAHSLAPFLDKATRAIAERAEVERCLVFLIDEQGDLVRRASSTSRSPAELADLEADAIAAQASAERRPAVVRGEATSLLATPMLFRDRVVGALVLQNTARRDYSTEDIATLVAIGAQLVGVVENARIIDALDRGDLPVGLGAPRVAADEARGGERVMRGVGASPGVAIGPAVFRGAYRLDLTARLLPAREPAIERARLRAAIDKARNDISRSQATAAREIDEEHALIFASHLLLLSDPTLLEHIDQRIGRGASAPIAIDAALDELESRLRLVPDAYIRERVDDVDDLRTRLLAHVLDLGGSARLSGGIVLAGRVPPSLVIELKTERAVALVTQTGGATSHGVLLARAMGIPVVTGLSDMLPSVRPGDQLIVDGTEGLIVVCPSEETVLRYEEKRRHDERLRTEHARFRDVLARTADGVRVTLHANVGVASDLTTARENGAEGIGLYRTEFPFIVRDAFPTRAEQVRIYRKAYEVFPAGPIQFRILDLSGDKFVTGGTIGAARDAFHGYRSIRVLFDHPDVLRDQVQALALAAGQRPLRILIPMVSSMEELRRVKRLIGEALASIDQPWGGRPPEIGAMIEVPAAVELAADIAAEVDFVSIGTNDLMQYALVVDREDSRMASMSDPYHPAILRMIARVAAAARAAGKPVGVCGEIAARPDVALALMALGIDSVSVAPTALPELKQALAAVRLEPMRSAIASILRLSDARSVAAALREARLP